MLGWTLAAIGDVDGDGIGDCIAGAPLANASGSQSGIVRLMSGPNLATIREEVGLVVSDEMGSSLCGMGDVDGDGVSDYAVGSRYDSAGNYDGTVRVRSGSDGTVLWQFDGVAGTNVNLGASVASGDWNADGVPDLLIGDNDYFDSASGLYPGSLDVELMCPA
jgi:hypothetical protein